jgi:hypothetical protein
MNLRTHVIRAAAAIAIAGGVVAAAAAPAAANISYFTTAASGVCDSATGEWVVDWALSNQSNETATLSAVDFAPAPGTLPETVAGNTTVHGTTRVPGDGTQGSLNYTSSWADGTHAANTWYFRPWTQCVRTVPDKGWSVSDTAGTLRGGISATPTLSNVCDQQADGVQVSIEILLTDGSTVTRIAPVGGCTPFLPFNGSKIRAVRGFADGFANDWHASVA